MVLSWVLIAAGSTEPDDDPTPPLGRSPSPAKSDCTFAAPPPRWEWRPLRCRRTAGGAAPPTASVSDSPASLRKFFRPVKTVLLVLALGLALASTAAAVAKPKPWMWTPARMQARLVAAQPFVFDAARLLTAGCTGIGHPVKARYSRFRCQISFGDANSSYAATVFTRVVPVGSGKLCVVATADGKAEPYTPGTAGLTVATGRVCP